MRGFELKHSCQILSNFSNKAVTSKHEHHKELVSLKKKKKKKFSYYIPFPETDCFGQL